MKENLILINGGDLMTLINKIVTLINTNKEGVFYDFKRKWSDSSDLLKDILSLANCNYEGDRYLIIGVGEDDGNFQVVGVDGSNRKTQAMLQDLLDNQSFAGDNVPKFKLETLNLEDSDGFIKEVDVIIIKNTRFKPYYLENNNGVCKSYVIWTRHNDRNSKASYYEIEEMWKEHLNLNNNEKENFKNFLKDYSNWEYNEEDKIIYYIPNSDYYIELGEIDYTDNMMAPFSKFYLDDEFHKCRAFFKIKDTKIKSCEYIYCDGFRIEFPEPELKLVKRDKYVEAFYYYLLDDLSGLFAYLLFIKLGFKSRAHKYPVIFFSNSEELADFLEFLQNFEEDIDIPISYYSIGAHRDNEYFGNIDLDSLRKNKFIYDYIFSNFD